jgi:hypothetical protein
MPKSTHSRLNKTMSTLLRLAYSLASTRRNSVRSRSCPITTCRKTVSTNSWLPSLLHQLESPSKPINPYSINTLVELSQELPAVPNLTTLFSLLPLVLKTELNTSLSRTPGLPNGESWVTLEWQSKKVQVSAVSKWMLLNQLPTEIDSLLSYDYRLFIQ